MSGLPIAEWADQIALGVGGSAAAVVGAVLLLFGRRIYWLFAAVVGFALLWVAAQRLMPELSDGSVLLAGLVAGVVGAVLAVAAHKLLLGLIGGLGGALVGLWQAQAFSLHGLWLLAAVVLSGLLGAWLIQTLFELALILLSSLVGAQLVVEALPVPAGWFFPAYIALAALGCLVQANASRKKKRRSD